MIMAQVSQAGLIIIPPETKMSRKGIVAKLLQVCALAIAVADPAIAAPTGEKEKGAAASFRKPEYRAVLSGVFANSRSLGTGKKIVIRLTITKSDTYSVEEEDSKIVQAEVQYAQAATRMIPRLKTGENIYSEKQEEVWDDIPWGRRYPATAYCSTSAPTLETIVRDAKGRNVRRKINVRFPADKWQRYTDIIPYIYFRMCHTADYRRPHVKIESRKAGLGYRYASIAGTMGSIPSGALKKHEVLQWGSRFGMVITVIAKRGIDTANAVIRVKYTRNDAEVLCQEYSRKNFDVECIKENMDYYSSEPEFEKQVRANCKTGTFTSLSGNEYKFLGKNRYRNGYVSDQAEYIFRIIAPSKEDSWLVQESGPSGYDITFDNFKALCPNRLKRAKLVDWPND